MIRATVALLLGLLVASCSRTFIRPASDDGEQAPQSVDNICNVRDYVSATDVPTGSRPLGRIEVESQESDEETFVALHQRVCQVGGDALSQAAWIRDPGEEKPRLTANAWSLP